MNDIPRLNGIIAALENGGTAFTSFSPCDMASAQYFSASKYDGVVFEMEHNPWDITGLRDGLQYMLDPKRIAGSGSVAPNCTPIVRIPPNGGEMSQWHAKQALDIGVYGVVWPHVSTVEQAYNAVAACRYPRPKTAEHFEPEGIRGDSPRRCARYWGIGDSDYYAKADVWPLVPDGEVLVILMCEAVAAVENLDEILKQVPGIGVILIGEGDLSQELGYPRQYEHPVVVEAITEIVGICKDNNVAVGHPHANAKNMDWIVEMGFRFIMSGPERKTPGLDKGRELAGRS